MLSERAEARGIKHDGAEREARVRGARGRDDRPGRPARRGHDRDQHGRPRRRHQARRRPRAARARPSCASWASRPDNESYEEELARADARHQGAVSRPRGNRSARPAGCSSAAPSATSRAGSTTSFAAAPAARATPASRASTSPPRTSSIRLFAGDRIYKILDRLGPVDEDGEEYPIEAKMLSKQIENAQKKVEEQNFLIRKRVLEYDDVMNEQRRVVYKYRARDPRGPRHVRGRRASRSARSSSGWSSEYTEGDVFEDWDLDGLQTQLEQIWPTRVDLGELDPQPSTARSSSRLLTEDALRRLRRARGGARRRADARARAPHPAPDHRRPLARAPLRDGLPARGHPPPRLRPDRPARRLQERGLQDVPRRS